MDYNHLIKNRMNLLELSCHQAVPEASLDDLLRVVFEAQGLMACFSYSNGKSSQQVQYLANLFLPRAQTHINAIWSHKTSNSIVMLNLSLNTQASALGPFFPEFLRIKAEEIQEWVYLLNNLQLCDSPGYFMFREQTGELQLRYKISKMRFLRSNQSMVRYFNRCMGVVVKRFIEELENLVFYYRLPGFSMLELEAQTQGNNFIPLGQETQNIMLMRQCFQADRRRRSTQGAEIAYNSQVAKAANLLMTGCVQFRSRQMPKSQEQLRIHSTQQMCRFQLSQLLSDISFKPQGAQSILTSIIIRQKGRENMIGAGGYAQIFHGIYSYVFQMSIYNLCTRPEIVIVNDEAVMKNCSLVKKVALQVEEGANVPLLNECSFLKYMRNKVCPYFAKYYCNNSNKLGPFANGEIYLEYYPFNLGQCRLREDRKMKVMEDVILALLFLNQEKIIHRDLKEVNIMIDRYHRGRLIDFGSVTSINGCENFQARDEKVRSTQGYFIPYREAVRMLPKIEERISQHDYYTHETYDLYGFGKILEKQFRLDIWSEESHFVRNNLRFLSGKCQEVNPEDRWTVPQVAIFLRHLLLFQELRKEFWKRGFDPRFRAHLLGTYYTGQGGYDERESMCEQGFALM